MNDDRPATASDSRAERALLSACIQSKNARIAAKRIIFPADFYQPAHEDLFAAMIAMDRAGRTVDAATLRATLIESGKAIPENLILDLASDATVVPEAAADHAVIVRRWAQRRRLADTYRRGLQESMNPTVDPDRLAAESVTRFANLRDHGSGDLTALTLGEVMETREDDTPKWVIPGLIESGDRLILTGTEGIGKSTLSRQFCVMGAAGVHPFSGSIMPPIRAMIVDSENKPPQIRRGTRPLLAWIRDRTHSDDEAGVLSRVLIDTPGRIDITRDRTLARLHQAVDAFQPHLLVLGPIYKMAPKGLNSDEEASLFLAAVDTITDRGVAVVLEAHAGHTEESLTATRKQRALRPRGSSVLMGWPEFGLGLRGLGGGLADLEPWRGGREVRAWPTRVRRAPGNRWIETHPDDRPGQDEPPDGTEDPQGSLV